MQFLIKMSVFLLRVWRTPATSDSTNPFSMLTSQSNECDMIPATGVCRIAFRNDFHSYKKGVISSVRSFHLNDPTLSCLQTALQYVLQDLITSGQVFFFKESFWQYYAFLFDGEHWRADRKWGERETEYDAQQRSPAGRESSLTRWPPDGPTSGQFYMAACLLSKHIEDTWIMLKTADKQDFFFSISGILMHAVYFQVVRKEKMCVSALWLTGDLSKVYPASHPMSAGVGCSPPATLYG